VKGRLNGGTAGEARGPESVWETLREFQPSRIGHGVRSIEDARHLLRVGADKVGIKRALERDRDLAIPGVHLTQKLRLGRK